jgi:hypothetical protein
VLDPDAIQGDILLGLQKLLERFVFFEIGDVPAFQLTLRGDLAGGSLRRPRPVTPVQLEQHKGSGPNRPSGLGWPRTWLSPTRTFSNSRTGQRHFDRHSRQAWQPEALHPALMFNTPNTGSISPFRQA